jgi:hypothetical protein
MTNKNKKTNTFGPPTPCIVCEKGLKYVEFNNFLETPTTDCIENANNFNILGGYGSSFDGLMYEAIICDECLDKLIQKGHLTAILK